MTTTGPEAARTTGGPPPGDGDVRPVGGAPRPEAPVAAADPVRLARLRWRCRRGMLENDLLLARFLDARGATLTEREVAQLDVLLDLSDNELWDVLAGRAEPADPALAPLVAMLASQPAASLSRPRGTAP